MPTSDEVYGELQLLLFEIYVSLEAAVAMAVDDCHARGRPIDRSFLAAYVRDETKGRLRALQGTSLECEVKALNNGGVQVVYQEFALRIRKERDGGLPIGQSVALQHYYEQYPLALLWPGEDEPVTTAATVNLVVLWDFDYETETLTGLDLVLPHQWRLAIPHPGEQILPDAAPEVIYEDVDVAFAEEDDVALEEQSEEEEEDEEESGG